MKTLPETYMERLREGVPPAVEDYWANTTLGRNHTPASCAYRINSSLFMGYTDRQWEMWERQLKQAVRDLVQEYYAQKQPEYPEADHTDEHCPVFAAWRSFLYVQYGLSDESLTKLERMVRGRMWDGEPFEHASLEIENVLHIARKDFLT